MKDFIILDIETTGLDPKNDKIVELACYNPRWDDYLHYYINPNGVKVSEEAFKIHGISDEFLSDKPKIENVWSDFKKFIGNSTLVIHNVNFDMSFLNEVEKLENETICSLKWFRENFSLERNDLDFLAEEYKVERNRRHHGALVDVKILTEVLTKSKFFENIANSKIQEIVLVENNEVLNLASINQAKEKLNSMLESFKIVVDSDDNKALANANIKRMKELEASINQAKELLLRGEQEALKGVLDTMGDEVRAVRLPLEKQAKDFTKNFILQQLQIYEDKYKEFCIDKNKSLLASDVKNIFRDAIKGKNKTATIVKAFDGALELIKMQYESKNALLEALLSKVSNFEYNSFFTYKEVEKIMLNGINNNYTQDHILSLVNNEQDKSIVALEKYELELQKKEILKQKEQAEAEAIKQQEVVQQVEEISKEQVQQVQTLNISFSALEQAEAEFIAICKNKGLKFASQIKNNILTFQVKE